MPAQLTGSLSGPATHPRAIPAHAAGGHAILGRGLPGAVCAPGAPCNAPEMGELCWRTVRWRCDRGGGGVAGDMTQLALIAWGEWRRAGSWVGPATGYPSSAMESRAGEGRAPARGPHRMALVAHHVEPSPVVLAVQRACQGMPRAWYAALERRYVTREPEPPPQSRHVRYRRQRKLQRAEAWVARHLARIADVNT